MKKGLICSLLVLVLISFANAALAVGPYMKDPHTAAWDANTETDLAGYYLYWRTVGGIWDNARRGQVGVSPTPTLDLLTVISANGNYEIAVSAYDTAGNESGLSNIVPFVVDVPDAPRNLRKQAP